MLERWSKQHWWVVVGGSIAILLLVAFGMGQRGANVAKAAEKLLTADTMHVKTELLINLPARFRGQERPFTKVIAQVEGDVKRSEDRTPELAGTVFVEARGRGNVFFADGQARILRERVLFNLDNLPVFLNPSGSLVKRWTRVEVPLLQARNAEQVREALAESFRNVQKAGADTIDGERLVRYAGAFSEEQEARMADGLRQDASGSLALHTLARLLDANRVEAFDVWVDTSAKEVRRIRVHFVRPVRPAQGEPFDFDFATLTMTFTDYGKDVVVDVPETRRVVQPAAFAQLFGGGKVEAVKVESERN